MDWDSVLQDFLRDDRLEPLVKDIGTMLGCPLLVVDIAFHIMASYVPEGFQDGVFEAALAGERSLMKWRLLSTGNGCPIRQMAYFCRWRTASIPDAFQPSIAAGCGWVI